MSAGPRDVQHIFTKSYFSEKSQDTEQRNPEVRQEFAALEQTEKNKRKQEIVNKTEDARNPKVDSKEKDRERRRRQKRKRMKDPENAEPGESGKIIDLEA